MQEQYQKHTILASVLLVTESKKVHAHPIVDLAKILVLILDDFL